MKTHTTFKSYNANKTIEELQYNLLQYKTRLETVIEDSSFYKYLLDAPVYKSGVINLFETLQHFKTEIDAIGKKATHLANEANHHINTINDKIECEDLACDNYFISEHDNLELIIHNMISEYTDLKSKMFQYLQSII